MSVCVDAGDQEGPRSSLIETGLERRSKRKACGRMEGIFVNSIIEGSIQRHVR
jgi:hypothetical protein